MAEKVEITGTVLDILKCSSDDNPLEGQKFLLVQDSTTQKKYPLYITNDLFSGGHKFWKMDLRVGDRVIVKGKVHKLVSTFMRGEKSFEESDLAHKDSGIGAYAEVVVPKEISKLEGEK
jgi:hypothetical protein